MRGQIAMKKSASPRTCTAAAATTAPRNAAPDGAPGHDSKSTRPAVPPAMPHQAISVRMGRYRASSLRARGNIQRATPEIIIRTKPTNSACVCALRSRGAVGIPNSRPRSIQNPKPKPTSRKTMAVLRYRRTSGFMRPHARRATSCAMASRGARHSVTPRGSGGTPSTAYRWTEPRAQRAALPGRVRRRSSVLICSPVPTVGAVCAGGVLRSDACNSAADARWDDAWHATMARWSVRLSRPQNRVRSRTAGPLPAVRRNLHKCRDMPNCRLPLRRLPCTDE